MGLDVSHDCWYGAYSAFSRWRDKLADVAGYAFAEIDYDGFKHNTILVDWGHLQDKLYGDWDKVPSDPLLILIAHSDCEGLIHPREAKALADRLETLLPFMPEGNGGGHIYDWIDVTKKFIDGLREAVAKNEDVTFG
jgi:hypothetical protein